MDPKATKWWDGWKKRAEDEYAITIQLWDETELRNLLLSPNARILRETYFSLYSGAATVSTLPMQQVPHQLPADIPLFVGRESELKTLHDFINSSNRSVSIRTVLVSVLSGTGGVGKSSLALHWAHQVRHQFPDGQLYVNLRGYDAVEAPRDPGDALGDILRALGITSEIIPENTEQRSALFRTLAADRKLLIILDNARSAAQVRPLLPGSGVSLTIITSRARLSSLVAREGAVRIDLNVLDPSEAVDLLRHIVGSERTLEDEDALFQLADLCARLPLALRIAAERVVSGSEYSIQALVISLSQEHARLEVLSTSDQDVTTAIESVFSWSYKSLLPNNRAFSLWQLASLS